MVAKEEVGEMVMVGVGLSFGVGVRVGTGYTSDLPGGVVGKMGWGA
jgi:hypothetical protein